MADSQSTGIDYDLAVIGGGINGCGIAADAAGRGLKVLLVERDDLASGTSSASSKLIHGGLRYLEHYEFRLVKDSLEEREVLLANAPHIVWPLRFVVPHVPQMRSRFLMRAGLFLYDHLATRRRIPSSRLVDLARDPAGVPISQAFAKGFSYWDCWVDDARLVVLVAKLAASKGARILTRTALMTAVADRDRWSLTMQGRNGASEATARVLINAAGPWAGRVARDNIRRGDATVEVPVRLVQGSHIVVPRIPEADCAYLLQADDGRVVFLLPFADRFTLVGTTDVPFSGNPAEVAISQAEQAYLLRVANTFLARSLTADDIVWRFSGVRPLFDDASDNPSAVTRDYKLALDAPELGPPLLTVVGGKVTTYRRLAESAMQLIHPHIGVAMGGDWTRTATLPGGDIPDDDFTAFSVAMKDAHPDIPASCLDPLLRRHGTASREILAAMQTTVDREILSKSGLLRSEIRYLRDQEWALTPDDVLWRRTKAGVGLSPEALRRAHEEIASVLET